MSSPVSQFDRDITLAELLRAVSRIKLENALTRILGDSWQIIDADGTTVLSHGEGLTATAIARPLRIDIEVIGRLLASDAASDPIDAAAMWLEMVLTSSYRYQMAADLHFEAVNADYAALQRQHAALQESEARYRELAAHLEQRVKTQVDVIERAQRQLYQSEKMASVGSLAAGMAHEINNPIGFIRSNLTTATKYVGKLRKMLDAFHRGEANAASVIWRELDIDFVQEDFSTLLAESITGADRITRIVANLKTYASIDCMPATEVDLNNAVRAVANVVADQLPEGVTLETDLQPLPNIVCDQSRMNQVLFALVQNARQAVEDDGLIRIASRIVNDEIQIAVSDNGRGIQSELLSHIFDPFFTTRDVGKGMGLGLTVSRDIINAHQGRIEVESDIGIGSTFTIYLPIVQIIEHGASPESLR